MLLRTPRSELLQQPPKVPYEVANETAHGCLFDSGARLLTWMAHPMPSRRRRNVSATSSQWAAPRLTTFVSPGVLVEYEGRV